MDEPIIIEGKEYISARRAAEIAKYANDYVGQLARGGKIQAQKVGKIWYVEKESLLKHKNDSDLKMHTGQYVWTSPAPQFVEKSDLSYVQKPSFPQVSKIVITQTSRISILARTGLALAIVLSGITAGALIMNTPSEIFAEQLTSLKQVTENVSDRFGHVALVVGDSAASAASSTGEVVHATLGDWWSGMNVAWNYLFGPYNSPRLATSSHTENATSTSSTLAQHATSTTARLLFVPGKYDGTLLNTSPTQFASDLGTGRAISFS